MGSPSMPDSTQIDIKEDKPAVILSISREALDTSALVSLYNIFFTAAETYTVCLHTDTSTESKISHQDTLLAHFWAAVIYARGPLDGKTRFMDAGIDSTTPLAYLVTNLICGFSSHRRMCDLCILLYSNQVSSNCRGVTSSLSS